MVVFVLSPQHVQLIFREPKLLSCKPGVDGARPREAAVQQMLLIPQSLQAPAVTSTSEIRTKMALEANLPSH